MKKRRSFLHVIEPCVGPSDTLGQKKSVAVAFHWAVCYLAARQSSAQFPELMEALINGPSGGDVLPEAPRLWGNILEFQSVFGAFESVSMPPGHTGP